MKNLTDKQKMIAISILIALFCIGFLLGIFTGIGRRNREYKESQLDNKIEENINNKVTTIDIQIAFGEENENKSIRLNQEEIYEIFNIIDNLQFSKETCDGLPRFYIKYNSEEKDSFITYGLEIFDSQYHITSSEKGEAILSQEQREKIDKILLKFNKDVSKKEYQTMAQEIENLVKKEFDAVVVNQQRNKE